ncbi:Lysosomal-associated transmembrane 4A [Brachionus plicatilis]|uniref:Lysosomal-associated transmembrane 4A n=1 Tax=Brachionus plicatilis TaxID=10195 RepID=A0A3M7S7C9_BRAPC|nr:Lysosomal-associated transmembrane 4A [Brachionus plicatilis]
MTRKILCCLKVKSATLLIGSIDLFAHVMFVLSLLTSWSHPSIFDHYYTNSFSLMASPSSNCQLLSKSANLDSPTAMPFAEATNFMAIHKYKRNSELTLQYPSSNQLILSGDDRKNPKDKSVYVFVTFFSILIISMLLYGIRKSKPSYLMPYFSIKVFQLVMATLATLSFYTCLPNVKLYIQNHSYFIFKSKLLSMENQSLDLLVFAILLASILVKFYVVIIVWYCYRDMITFESFRNQSYSASGNGYLEESNTDVKFDEESYMTLPPKYEEVVKDNPAPTTSSLMVTNETTNQIDYEPLAASNQVPSYSQAIMSKQSSV